MAENLISIHKATLADAENLADIHASAWRQAYQGIIPGLDLERFVVRRGAYWWASNIRRQGMNILVFSFDEKAAGYASFGRSRNPNLSFKGEIFELYLKPEYQGLGFGGKLFQKARSYLKANDLNSLMVWALIENTPACAFYRAMGGKIIAKQTERFGSSHVKKLAFGWQH